MNLFVWSGLTDPKLLSFILRRTYNHSFEAALLKGWSMGAYHRGFLFPLLTDSVDAFVAPEVSAHDFLLFDKFHAVEEGVHRRVIQSVNVVRNGRGDDILAHVYVAGPAWHKIRGGRLT